MPAATLYHNPRCSASRKALEVLQKAGADVAIRLYLQEPLTKDEVLKLAAITDGGMDALLRKKETLYSERIAEKALQDDEIAQLLADNPILLNRPVAAGAHKAVAARPAELALTVLED